MSEVEFPSSGVEFPSSGVEFPSSDVEFPSSGVEFPSSDVEFRPWRLCQVCAPGEVDLPLEEILATKLGQSAAATGQPAAVRV
eukprot:3980283-Pyramimonas_sp.AAC.1